MQIASAKFKDGSYAIHSDQEKMHQIRVPTNNLDKKES